MMETNAQTYKDMRDMEFVMGVYLENGSFIDKQMQGAVKYAQESFSIENTTKDDLIALHL